MSGADEQRLSRRGLLGAGAGLASAALVVPGDATASKRHTRRKKKKKPAAPTSLLPADRIGLQLYTVRDQVTAIGFGRVFEAVAAMGYKHVEFNGLTQGSTPEITPIQLKRLLDLNGLTGIGNLAIQTNAPLGVSDSAFEQMLDDAQTLGLPQIGISVVVPQTPTVSGWQAAADSFNHLGSLAAKRGMRFYLHNHFQEWMPCADSPNRRGEDVLLLETDPNLVWFEMDIYWAFVGQWQSGQLLKFDPLRDYLIPHRQRYLLLHVKDGKPDQTGGYTDALDDIVDVGEGKIDYVTFFTTLMHQSRNEKQDHWYIVERDNANDHPRGSLAAAHMSYLYLRHGLLPGLSFGGMT